MIEQNFATKQLYQVSLKANTDMKFGYRRVVAGEPVLYFDNIEMAQTDEYTQSVAAKGGWGNMPRVLWEDRREITFNLKDGVMNNIGLGLILGAKVVTNESRIATYIPKREGPFPGNRITLSKAPTDKKPIFCYEFENNCLQSKVDVKISNKTLRVVGGSSSKNYIVDYYYQYGGEAVNYLIGQERFNGTFTLEGRFYTKDENEGNEVTNLLIMPKVRIISGVNLRLGEGVEPVVSSFNLTAMPVQNDDQRFVLAEFIKLPDDIDEIEI